MDRKQLLENAFQRGHLLNLKSDFYRKWISEFLVEEAKGDLGEKGDITTDTLVKKPIIAQADIMSREPGILAGIEEMEFLLSKYNVRLLKSKKDGDKIKENEVVAVIEGKSSDILKVERSAVDLLQRMSGIATLAHNLTKRIESRIPIAPTRKTQFRYLDKKACFVGGALTHRLALWESILIKENHLAILKKEGIKNPVKEAIMRAWKNKNNSVFIEIETTNRKEAITAAETYKILNKKQDYPCLIMLDNFTSKEIKETITELKKREIYSYALIEISGGITPKNLEEYSKTGADVISMGYLTNSVRALSMTKLIR